LSASLPLFSDETLLAEGMSHMCKMLEKPLSHVSRCLGAAVWDLREQQAIPELCSSLFYSEEPVLLSET